MAMVFVDNSCL